MSPSQTRTWYGPIADQGKPRHRITYQGEFLRWQYPEFVPVPKPGRTRGEVTHFSAASRKRIFEWMAKIKWADVGNSLFITLTYPDECFPADRDQMNKERYLFKRHIEEYLERDVSMLWRIEWKERKQGPKKNYIYPHLHWLVFNVDYIHYSRVNSWWKNVLGYRDYTRTETKRAYSKRKALAYVSKYCAKADGSLVHAAYLNNPIKGRQWGHLRKELLPYHDEHYLESADCEYLQQCWNDAMRGHDYRNAFGNKSFTLFGEQASEIGNFLFGICVDGQVLDV